MTVQTETNVAIHRGNGAATVFPFSFKVLDADHLIVERRLVTTALVDKTYVPGEYTVTGIGDEAGEVTIVGTPLSADYDLIIRRELPYTQDLDIVNQGGFYPDEVEAQLDRTTMQIQQIAEAQDRMVSVPFGEEGLVLPPSAGRAGMFLAFDANGDPVLSSGTGADGALRSDLAAGTGADLVGFIRRSLADKAEEEIALPDARQSADDNEINALAELIDSGYRRIRLPGGKGFGNGGTYLLETPVGTPNIVSGLKLVGDGIGRTRVERPYAVGGDPWYSILFCNSGSEDPADNITDVLVRGIVFADSKLLELGFREHHNLLHLNGVTRFLADRCGLEGFRSDGIYLGSGHIGGTERHNEDCGVFACWFDGINKNNRNGLTIIDMVRGNFFLWAKNCTRPGDGSDNYPTTPEQLLDPNYGLGMPGPVDVEPDLSTFHRISDLAFDVQATDCGGHAVALLLHPQGYDTYQTNNLRVRATAKNCKSAFGFNGYGASDALTADKGYGLQADIDATNCPSIASINGDLGGRYRFRAMDCGTLKIGNAGFASRDTRIVANFERCGNSTSATPGKPILISASTKDLQIIEGVLSNCGVTTDGVNSQMIFFQGGAHTGLVIEDNYSPTVAKGALNNTQWLGAVGGGGAPTFDATSRMRRNKLGWSPTLADAIDLIGADPSPTNDMSGFITYLSGTTAIGGGETPKCIKDRDGFVWFGGGVNVTTLTDGTTLVQLPITPAHDIRLLGICNSTGSPVRGFRLPTTNNRITIEGGDLPAGTTVIRFPGQFYRAAS